MKIGFIIALFSANMLFAQTRTLNEINRARGYIEYGIGKKYKPHFTKEKPLHISGDTLPKEQPPLLKYSHFYGIPVSTIHVKTDKHQRIERIEFTFGHPEDSTDNNDEYLQHLLDLFDKPNYILGKKKSDSSAVKRIWETRKLKITCFEPVSTLYPLELTIEGR